MSDEDRFDPPARLTTEEIVAERVSAYRELKLMTQSSLADAMKAAGHRWSQSTVYKVENGERKLTFTEGLDLARILGVGPSELAQLREISGEIIRMKAQAQMIPHAIRQAKAELESVEAWLTENRDHLYRDELDDFVAMIRRGRKALGNDEAPEA